MTVPMVLNKVQAPLGLVHQINGDLKVELLKPVGFNEFLYTTAADWFLHLKNEFETTQHRVLNFTHGGCYRNYPSQKGLFLKRYERVSYAVFASTRNRDKKKWPAISASDPRHADNPTDTYWRVKVNYEDANGFPHYFAAAAVPGYSNHGLGLAVDLAIGLPSQPASLTAPDIEWLKINVGRFGFTYESTAEPWHVTYYIGDGCPPYMSEKH